MTGPGQDLQPFVAAALRLANLAGVLLLRHRSEAARHPESKGQRRELVTAADRAAEHTIVSGLLAEFPDVTVIWAHGGYTPVVVAARMLRAHPNLVYELSARTWRRHPRSPEYTIFGDEARVRPEWLALIEAMPTRFVVGTDAPVRSRSSDLAKIRGVEAFLAQLSPRARRLVARENLEQILK